MQKLYLPAIILKTENLIYKIVFIIFICLYTNDVLTQNSMVGDGFGGRLWYKPYNYSVGSYSAYTICGDSSQLYGWGDNEHGQLGIGTNVNSSTPAKIPGMTNALYYSTGYIMGAIKKNKTGWVWGEYAGYIPVKVIDRVKFLDAGMNVCTFVKNDGTVWSVGKNSTGSFGNGARTENISMVPVKMIGINTAVRVANSGRNNIILLKDGTVMSAGLSFSNINEFVPTRIQGLENIVDIKANNRGIVALDKDGNIFTWGDGHFGTLGNGFLHSTNIPTKINTLKNIVAISGCNDGEHFLALDSAHHCYAWGYNGYGQCGINDQETVLKPTLVASDVEDIMAGERFSYIIKKGGELWASGASKGGSIWMNLNNVRRYQFSRINPDAAPMNMCRTEHLATKVYKNIKITLCRGDSFRIRNQYYNTAGNYQDTLLKDTCMDTISTLHLTFNNVLYTKQHISLCSGEKYKVGQNVYFSSGTFSDTFSNYKGCDSVISTTIHVLPVSHFTQTIEFCEGGKYWIGHKYYYRTGIYKDTFQNHVGCDSIVTTFLIVNPLPTADFEINSVTAGTGDTIQLINLSIDSDTHFWEYGDSNTITSNLLAPKPIFQSGGTKNIQLISMNSLTGCADSIIKQVDITDNTDIYIPNVFTPNQDNVNDFFFPVSRNYNVIKMQIFNRWGELIYQCESFSSGWDGTFKNKNCPQDIYIYSIELNNTFNFKLKKFSGTLTLLR